MATESISDSVAVAAAAGPHLLDNERIYRVVPVPQESWISTESEYLVDLAPLEPGEIVAQLVATRDGTSWKVRRERWMFAFLGFVNPRAVSLRPPIGVARGSEILNAIAPRLYAGEVPLLVEDLTALELSHGSKGEDIPPPARHRYWVRTQLRVPPYRPNRVFIVGADGDSVVVESTTESIEN